MSKLSDLAQKLTEARAELHEAGVNDYLRAFLRGDYDSYEEAMEACGEPAPATEEDARKHLERWGEREHAEAAE